MRRLCFGGATRSALSVAALNLGMGCIVGSAGCTGDSRLASSEVSTQTAAQGDPLTTEATLGPVTASVTLTPRSPLIGDLMDLTFEVVAAKGVRVEMPRFEEAFSRFSIEGYSDDQSNSSDGVHYVQRYRLYASVSGRLRVPPLRVEFFDERKDSENDGKAQELLTEELSLSIRPVLEGEEASAASLRPMRSSLEEYLGPSFWQRYWWAGFACGTFVGLFGVLYFMRRKRHGPTISPYERASVALSLLESRGLPDEESRDPWYVQLSSIVRCYLEDRFALRAPELTSEEFLRVAQRSDRLSEAHKKLLATFLLDCDKVKFAGYKPGEEESQAVLEAARRFLLETRSEDEASGEQSAETVERDLEQESA